MTNGKIFLTGATLALSTTISGVLNAGEIPFPDNAALHELAVKDSMIPIRPGGGGEPFWNGYARQFINVPSFDFKTVEGATEYSFTVIDGRKNLHVFNAVSPQVPLTPVWAELPEGMSKVTVDGVDAGNKVKGEAGSREFYRAAVFRGGYLKAACSYRESARRALEFIFRQPYSQHWLKEGKPDPNYELFCYPAKIIASIVRGMAEYSQLDSANSQKALAISEAAARFLIEVSEPRGNALEYMPPTYMGDRRTAKQYAGQNMLIYPAGAAMSYLDLFDVDGKSEFRNAALRIAQTYVKLQLPSGSWPLKVRIADGKPVVENLCIPFAMLELFDRLDRQYGYQEFRRPAGLAFQYIMENPVKTFNWEGQFEDIAPTPPYANHSKHLPCSFAIYLLRHVPEQRALGKELLRFAEDQFVVWEKPLPRKDMNTGEWLTPCVLEQYHYYLPIDASAAKLIATFQAAYENTGEILYLAKACQLANAMTTFQDKDGRYPTYWQNNAQRQGPGWVNCAVEDARAMSDLAVLMEKTH